MIANQRRRGGRTVRMIDAKAGRNLFFPQPTKIDFLRQLANRLRDRPVADTVHGFLRPRFGAILETKHREALFQEDQNQYSQCRTAKRLKLTMKKTRP